MSNLEKWENIIKEKRKKTNFRDFIKEIPSWLWMVFYRNEGVISRYPHTDRSKICDVKVFDDENSKVLASGLEYDDSIDFFDNVKSLFLNIKLPSMLHYWIVESSEYADSVLSSNRVYLSNIVILNCENIFYSAFVRENCKDVYNSIYVIGNNSIIYFSKGIQESYKIFYSKYIIASNNIWFSSNLIWCQECIFCDNLENKSYFINNQEFTKEEYLVQKSKILVQKNIFMDFFFKVNNRGKNYGSTNVAWVFLTNCEDVENSACSMNIKNGRHVFFAWSPKWNSNLYDAFPSGAGGWDDFYAMQWAGWGSSNVYCSMGLSGSTSIYYSYFLENCSFCLACVWLKNKSFCILNKQYSKEEWHSLTDKIFSQMNDDGILWDFFPWSLNPFYFNDTAAYLIDDSFTKEEVEKDGYLWRDEAIKVDIPENAEVLNSKDLNKFQGFDENWNWLIDPEIMKKVIKDEKWNIYRIVKMEYDFLMKHWLPLPEIHWLERIKMWFKF